MTFGPAHAPLGKIHVQRAIEEAVKLVPKPRIVLFAAFQFDPEAQKDIDEIEWAGVNLIRAQMNADLLTADLKKKRSSNQSFWLVGQPDVEKKWNVSKTGKCRFQIVLKGFDYYNTKTEKVESGGPEKIAMWLLDTDYDGRSLFPQQVFLPMSGPKSGWTKFAKTLKAEIDQNLIKEYQGYTSLPFDAGKHSRAAVKIIDDRGIECLRLVDLVQ